MTRRARNAPVQLIPTEFRKEQLAELTVWWREDAMSKILDRAVEEAYWREWAKRQQEQQGEGEGEAK